MKKLFGVVIGALLIVTGVLYVLSISGVLALEVSFDGWWTVFIIVPALQGLLTSRNKIGNLMVLLLGVYLFLAAQSIIEYESVWKFILPTILTLLGIKLIIKALKPESEDEECKVEEKRTESLAVFGENKSDYSGEEVRLAKVGAVFGGAKCNLCGANFTEKSRLDLFCLFGGADVIIPEDVEIKVNALCLFGGISDKRAIKDNSQKSGKLTINGFCLFGGADIK